MLTIAPAPPCNYDEPLVLEVVDGSNEDSTPTIAGLVDLLLKDQSKLNAIARGKAHQGELLPRLLAIGLLGYAVFGLALAVIFTAVGRWPTLQPIAAWLEQRWAGPIALAPLEDASIWSPWTSGAAPAMSAAYVLGLIGALCVCLPSFYFYGLLAGVRVSMLDVTVLAAKTIAAGSVALIGVLPIYVAVALAAVVFAAPGEFIFALVWLGMLLPFIAGLRGTWTLYVSFLGWCDTMPLERRARRACFLRRLLFAWSGCYTAVAPVMIYSLWERLQ